MKDAMKYGCSTSEYSHFSNLPSPTSFTHYVHILGVLVVGDSEISSKTPVQWDKNSEIE